MRGIGNTKITGGYGYRWTLTGSNISCDGNIENLLDYQTVLNGEHPTMATSCYSNMFYNCTSLIKAPALPATTLADYCYQDMFIGCSSLTTVPALPAIILKSYCYYWMFFGCSKIKLSATKTGTYTQEYRIPTSGTGTTVTNALKDMFIVTGGTFKGTPEINTTYYLDESNSIVPPPSPVSKGETWVINENPTISAENTFNLSFTSNQQSFSKIVFTEEDRFGAYLYYDSIRVATTGGSSVYMFDDAAYRTITFDSPVIDSKLLTWLQNNALKA